MRTAHSISVVTIRSVFQDAHMMGNVQKGMSVLTVYVRKMANPTFPLQPARTTAIAMEIKNVATTDIALTQ